VRNNPDVIPCSLPVSKQSIEELNRIPLAPRGSKGGGLMRIALNLSWCLVTLPLEGHYFNRIRGYLGPVGFSLVWPQISTNLVE
jgi:hypothetical protein